jgi:hypothetical protein
MIEQMVMTRPATKTAIPINSTQSIDQSPSSEGVHGLPLSSLSVPSRSSDKGRDAGSSARQTAGRRCTVAEFRLALPAITDRRDAGQKAPQLLALACSSAYAPGELRPHRDDVDRVPPYGKATSASYRKLSWKVHGRIVTHDLLTTTVWKLSSELCGFRSSPTCKLPA